MKIEELATPFLNPMSNLKTINTVLEQGYEKDGIHIKIYETMSRIATICAWSGNFDLAIKKAKLINQLESCKVSSYCEIAKALIVANQKEKAISIIEEIQGIISENGRLLREAEASEAGPSCSSSPGKENPLLIIKENSNIDNFLKIAKVWSKIDPQKSLSICSEIEPRIRSQSSERVHFLKKMALLCARINLDAAMTYANQLDEVEKLRVILQMGMKIFKMKEGMPVAKKLVSAELENWKAKQPSLEGKSFGTMMKGQEGLKPREVVLFGLRDKPLSVWSAVPTMAKDALGLFQYQIGDDKNARANILKYIKHTSTPLKLQKLCKKWVKFDFQLSYTLSLDLPPILHEQTLQSILKTALKVDDFFDVVSFLEKNTSHSITANTIADLTICRLKGELKAKYSSANQDNTL